MPRRYSEEDAQRIFALVAERQRTAPGAESGLSLAELEEAARAAGLDPSLVAAAAAEVDAAPGPDRTLAGAPVEVVRQRVLPGAVDDEAWAQMVGAMRAEFGQAGMAGQVGRLREWTLLSGGTKNGTTTRLTVEPMADGTRVTLSRSVREAVFGFTLASVIQWVMASVFATLALAGVENDLWIPAGILVAMALLFGVGTQVGTRLWHRHQSARLERLLDRLELTARDAERERPAASDEESLPERRLNLDALAEPEDERAASASRRRSRT